VQEVVAEQEHSGIDSWLAVSHRSKNGVK
jgi:hypothetical protein